MLPAGNGDCLWLEYGPPGATRIVIIDGGVRDTAGVLQRRIDAACRERGSESLEVELLVVTHIDNDHIQGILALLAGRPALRVKDVWFNGRPQLIKLPRPQPSEVRKTTAAKTRRANRPADLMGGPDEDDEDENDDDDFREEEAAAFDDAILSRTPADLLGAREGDALSTLIPKQELPWNAHPLWNGSAVMIPDSGRLPVATLPGDLRLTGG